MFNDTQQVIEFVTSRPLVIIGFFQVLGARGGRWLFDWEESYCLGGGGVRKHLPLGLMPYPFFLSNELVFQVTAVLK